MPTRMVAAPLSRTATGVILLGWGAASAPTKNKQKKKRVCAIGTSALFQKRNAHPPPRGCPRFRHAHDTHTASWGRADGARLGTVASFAFQSPCRAREKLKLKRFRLRRRPTSQCTRPTGYVAWRVGRREGETEETHARSHLSTSPFLSSLPSAPPAPCATCATWRCASAPPRGRRQRRRPRRGDAATRRRRPRHHRPRPRPSRPRPSSRGR